MTAKRHICVTVVYSNGTRTISEQQLCCDVATGIKIPKEFKKRLREELGLILNEIERVIA